MGLKLYGFDQSPPTLMVKTICDYLNVKYEYIYCHPGQGHTRTPEFLKVKFELLTMNKNNLPSVC